MKFKNAAEVEQVCWCMKEADYPRGGNRKLINDLFNGVPPYSQTEVQENNIAVNVNFLESTRLSHDARSQYYNAFMKPGVFFTARTDMGPVHKRQEWGSIVTKEINRTMKKSLPYFEDRRSKIAGLVLHGIGPSSWSGRDIWRPKAIGVEDVLVPATTLLTMDNLPFFALYKQFTAPELMQLTRGPQVDPGWNMDLVKSCIEWIDRSSLALMGTNWPEIWAPEKLGERIKGDGGFYVGDQVPTINCFDFYYYDGDPSDKKSGWRRKIILDSWSTPQAGGDKLVRRTDDIYRGKTAFLYDCKERRFASSWREIIAFQFADLSAVAPFRYHTIRSLGWLMYAICHLQNRMRCRFSEAVFEALMMYFRVKSLDDAQRALKIELVNRGLIEEGISMVPGNERYQVNAPLVQMGLMENQRLINENSSSFKPNTDYSQGGVEKTRFQVMAETNSVASLVGAGLTQAYAYQTFEDQEVFRRFCKTNSSDMEVNATRARILRQGVPVTMLCPEYWDLEPERVMGAGNKTLEMTIAQQLMEWRGMFDPEPQRAILRGSVLAITDDAAKAEALVPEKPVKVTDSVHDAQLAAGALMQGLPVDVKTGMNHIEYIETLMVSMATVLRGIGQNLATQEQITGLNNMAQNIAGHIQILAQDESEAPRAKQYSKQLSDLMNLLRAHAQRLDQHMQKMAEQNGAGADPEKMQKLQADQMAAQQKQENARLSHAERTAQRRVTFEQQTAQKQAEHQLAMQRRAQEAEIDLRAMQERARIDIETERAKANARAKAQASKETTATE